MAATINYLYDVTFSIRGAGADDGAATASGTPEVFKADSVRITKGNTVEDHSAGQDEVEWMRGRKKTQSMDISKRMEFSDPVAAILAANDLVEFTIAGANVPADLAGVHIGIVTNRDGEFGAPSNLNFSIGSYGTAWT